MHGLPRMGAMDWSVMHGQIQRGGGGTGGPDPLPPEKS